ncbi:MAG: lysophospholipid acyltransferase family protein [Ilumatobacteraceae bacterium]
MAEVSSKLAGSGLAARAFYRTIKGLVLFLARVLLRVEFIGLEHVPRTGPFIVAPTHRSLLDIPVAAGVTSRRVRFMGKDSLWKVPIFGRFLSALGGFPVTRGSADLEALKRCIGVLRNGEPLVLFPEGTRHHGPVIAELFDGAAFVAAKAGVQVVPVAIAGTEVSFSLVLKRIGRLRCTGVIGRPIGYASSGRQTREDMALLTGRLQGELQSLYDEANRRVVQRLK